MRLSLKKFGQSLILGTAIAAFLPLWAHAETPEDISAEALALAAQEDHSGALKLIASQPDEVRDTYDVRFTQARILAWSGNHDASAAAYEKLMQDFPGNPDIQNGYGYLEYYRSNLEAAEILFNQVLASYPGYEDAQKGLTRVRRAMADRIGTDYRWRIDANLGLSSFNNGQDDWNDQSLRVEYVPGSIGLFGSATRFERFGLNDIQFMGGARSNTDSDFDWEIAAGATPNADFRAELTGLARLGYKFDIGNDNVLHSSLGYQIDDFSNTGTVHQISPQIVTYLNNGMILNARIVHVLQSGESDQTGFQFSGLVPVIPRLNLRAGYANAPEAVNGVVIDTESLFGGLSYRLSDHTEIHGTYTRDDRKGVYIRDGFNVGLTQKY